jgi:hypothetical protein
VEKEKRQLEVGLEKMTTLEREKARLEVKLSRMDDLEHEKRHLQLKVRFFFLHPFFFAKE